MPVWKKKQKKSCEKLKEFNKNAKGSFLSVVKKIATSVVFLLKRLNIANIKLGCSSIKISKEGKSSILCMLVVFLVSFIISGFGCITTIILFLLLIVVYFFRDPERVLPDRSNIVISPCDGLILNIETSSLPEELGGKDASEYTKISVFMNVTDVHVQRMPVSCKVKQIEYIKRLEICCPTKDHTPKPEKAIPIPITPLITPEITVALVLVLKSSRFESTVY